MPFGISSASDIMQKKNEETFDDIQGGHVIANDLIIAAPCDQGRDIILNIVHVTKGSSSTVTKLNSRSVRSNTWATLFHLRA